jgi:hypothetical protein
MSLRALLNSLVRNGFFPVPGFAEDYVNSERSGPSLIDVAGALFTRGPVLTDEGGFRDDFPGNALGADWTSFVTGVPTITVAGSSVSFNVPALAAIGDRAIVSREVDCLPLIANIAINNVAARVPGYDFFMGFYNDPDPELATVFVEQRFLGTKLGAQSNMLTQNGAGNAETVADVFVQTTAAGAGACSWRTIALDGESAVFRDVNTATNALPTTNARLSQSRHTPDLYQNLFFAMGIRISLAVGPVVAANLYSVDTVFVKNANRLVVNTAF